MKYILVIPTFAGHLEQVRFFLQSFNRFCIDKKDIPVKLIISSNEQKLFLPLIRHFAKKINLEAVDLRAILKSEENINITESQLLRKVGKFNFQSIKKIYSVKYFSHNCALVLDSEAILIRPTRFKNIFKDFLKHKFIIYSQLGSDPTQKGVTENAHKILGKKFRDLWMFEYQYWFYEKKQVEKLFAFIRRRTQKSLLENLMLFQPIFEFNLYAFFLFYFGKNEYEFIDAQKLLKKFLGKKEFQAYQRQLKAATLFEYFPWGLTSQNFIGFRKIFQRYKLHFFKYDDRFDQTENTRLQQKFIQSQPQIKLLPCRVVGHSFKVGNFLVPANHDLKHNQPIMTHSGFQLSLVIRGLKEQGHYLRILIFFWKEQLSLALLETMIQPHFGPDGEVFLERVVPKKKPTHLKIDPKLCFDVGAFTGNSISRLRSLKYTKILCFEPSKSNFLKLFRSFQHDKHIAFINRAVSDSNRKKISFFQNPFLPWLNTTDSKWITNTRHVKLIPKLQKTTVITTTLDEVIDRMQVIPYYIKVDVEGHELSVLKGLHTKPKLLSFEWISERMEQNLLVAQECKRLGFNKFYLLEEENVPIYSKKNRLSFKQLIKKWQEIKNHDQSNSSWGSIWCQ